MIILLATFPIPPSINEMYPTDLYTGKRFLSEKGVSWLEEVFSYLDFGRAAPPYHVHYMNSNAIAEIRTLYAIKSRAKKVVEAKKYYRISTLLVLSSERRDIDGGHKIMQDALFDWIAMRRDDDPGVSFNDRRTVEVHMQRCVDKTVPEHIEVYMEECAITWKTGDLIERGMHVLQEEEFYNQPFWQGTTLRTRALDISEQQTASMPAITRQLTDVPTPDVPTQKVPAHVSSKKQFVQTRLFK